MNTEPIEAIEATTSVIAIARRWSGRRQGEQRKPAPRVIGRNEGAPAMAALSATPDATVEIGASLAIPTGLSAEERILYVALLRETGDQALALAALYSMRRRRPSLHG